jgi:xylulokinase
VILTLDLGTSVTKAMLWDAGGLVAQAGVGVETLRPRPRWLEQDPSAWWSSLTEACSELRARAGERFGAVDVVGCTGTRQSVVLADAAGAPLGPAIIWSDRRADVEAEQLAAALGGEQVFARTGVPLEAGAVAAKIAWLARNDGERLEGSAWVLAPRDFMAWRLTGQVVTDPTMASRSGLYDLDGRVVDELAGAAGSKLAPVVPSDAVSGRLHPDAAAALGLVAGTPVVIGAGDRACEVLGSGASPSSPMVSWGTTANVSLPLGARPTVRPPGMVLARDAGAGWSAGDDATGGWLLEGGLSAAGSFLAWLGRLTGRGQLTASELTELADLASQSPPGARGVVATPWLDGARAPWWDHRAGAAFTGLHSDHGLADLVRAAFESVAREVVRCLEAMAVRQPTGPALAELAGGGVGAAATVWLEVLTGVTGLAVTARRSGQAASAGAAVLAARAVDMEFDLDTADPVDRRVVPDPVAVRCYADGWAQAQRVAAAVIDLTGSDAGPGPAAGSGRPAPEGPGDS